MLHHSLKKAGSSAAYENSSAHIQSLVEVTPAKPLRTNFYKWAPQSYEMNYRKHPLLSNAYSPKLNEMYNSFCVTVPRRHISKVRAGMWFAAGHEAPTHPKHYGLFSWKYRARMSGIGVSGLSIPFFHYYFRIAYVNRWEAKNRGAVIGE